MTHAEALVTIDNAVHDISELSINRVEIAAFERGAQFMLHLLHDRPELLVVFDEVEALVYAIKWNYLAARQKDQPRDYAIEYAMEPFTKESP